MTKDKNSYLTHDSQYSEAIAFEREKNCHEKYEQENAAYNPDCPIGKMFDKTSDDIKIAIDVGCGTGYMAKFLSSKMKVYAIEPSAAALDIAKKFYPDEPNITWINNFALEALQKLTFDEPVFIVCNCVLSHLEDEAVIEICKELVRIAVSGSVIAFSECYGPEAHSNLWHIRTQAWWQKQFPDWYLNFNTGTPIQNVPGRYKGFFGLL
jgi:2-polyprenyl-3-methyl-5-hydroxy-6-metoxy-1,4-benzoquinol methylase